MELFYRFFSWPIRALDWASARTVTLLGLKASPAHASAHTAEELRQLIDLSHRGGQLKPSQRAILSRALEFSGLTARDAMVPRPAVEAVAENMSLDEIVTRIRESGYSRLPVYRESLDEIVGIIHTKELLAYWDNREGFAPPPCSTRPTSSPTHAPRRRPPAHAGGPLPLRHRHRRARRGRGCDHARRFARRDRRRDSDEFDDEAQLVRRRPDGTHLLDGSLPVRSANRRLGLGLPEDGVYHTLAGFMAQSGRVLSEGDTVTFGGGRVHRPQSDRHRIRTVRMEVAAANCDSP